MSVRTADSGYAEADSLRLAEDDRGYGWVLFAGVMLGLLGTVNFIEGIAAISRSHFFVANAHYVFGDLRTWGWIALILGVLQGLTSLGIFVKNQLARWAGVGFAVLNAIAQLLFMSAYPFWALSLFALNILVIYGLVAHGGRSYSTA